MNNYARLFIYADILKASFTCSVGKRGPQASALEASARPGDSLQSTGGAGGTGAHQGWVLVELEHQG